MRYCLDTNTLIYYTKDYYNSAQLEKFEEIFYTNPVVSFITEIELLSWKAEARELVLLKEFISTLNVYDINSEIKTNTAFLRKNITLNSRTQ